ncbi:hypothetical protein ACWD0E_01025 [Streptomyces sp. NPDC003002]
MPLGSGSRPQEPTYEQRYEEAKRRNLHGRWSRNTSELKSELGT